MHEVLSKLSASDRALDLGGRTGSFPRTLVPGLAVVVDIEAPASRIDREFVQADASALPFLDDSFTAVIANHSLEHIAPLQASLVEIRRVAAPGARLFASVPDSTTFSDRLYRWLGRGGGHVNPFPNESEFVARVSDATALRHLETRLLHSSYSFLNRNTFEGRGPMKLLLFGAGSETFVRLLTLLFRALDRRFGWRLSVYGWACHFGARVEVDAAAHGNVCVRCGSAASEAWILSNCDTRISPLLRLRAYHCRHCGAWNYLTAD